MRDDTALLVSGDDQRRKIGIAAPLLKRCDFGFQRLGGAAGEIVPGDIDAGNQSLFGELRYLLEGGIANDKMPSECVRLSNFGMQHIALADLKRNMCAQHRYWRETP